MNEVIQELLPYVKGYAGLYLAGNIIETILTIGAFICMLIYIVKRHKKFDKEFKRRWK